MQLMIILLSLMGGASIIVLLTFASSTIQQLISNNARGANYKTNQSEKESKRSDNKQSSPLPENKDPVANAITAYRNQRDAHERDRAEKDQWTIIILSFTGVFAFLAAGAAIVSNWIFYGQLDEARVQSKATEETMIASNRAWLAPTHIQLLIGIENKEGPSILVHYQNVGRFPALDVKNGGGWVTVPLASPIVSPTAYPDIGPPTWEMLKNTIRVACLTNEPLEGAGTVFPSLSVERNFLTIPQKFDEVERSEVLVGRKLIIVNGCLTYRTFDHVRHTSFCSYLVKYKDGQWGFAPCPVANFAD